MSDDGESKSEIQRFFDGKNVFLTGGTGFVGHLIIEKLLRSCFLSHLYLMVRPKKNKDAKVRLREMFSSPVFKKLWEEQPDFINKVLLISGDCSQPNLDLLAADERFIIENVDVIIHCAATINLNGPLKNATFINVRSTRDLLLIAQRMQKLKSFVYVSTAFSNLNQSFIEEKIYDCHIKGDTLINMAENMSDSLLNSITPKCLGTWPNTYTLSKCIAENIVKEYGQNLPICISRPCIVTFTADEPTAGWATSFKSVPGLCLGIGLGAIHVVFVNRSSDAIIAPADNVANMIITSAWHTAKKYPESSIPIFNYVPNNMAPPLTFGQSMDYIVNLEFENKLFSEKEVWKPYACLTDSTILYTTLFFLYHYLPALFIDGYLKITGKRMRVTKLYKKLDVMMRDMKNIVIMKFKFDDRNLKALISSQSKEDKKLFNMDLTGIDWKTYFLNCLYGCRRNILNESDDTIPASYERHKKIMTVYYIINVILYGSLLYFIYLLLKMTIFAN